METADIAAAFVRALHRAGRTVVTAESCTAGRLASQLAGQNGAGKVLHGGFVVYTKPQKTAALGVPPDLLAAQSAVAGPVAESMARGALARSPADVALAITGVAGPEPDEDGNPVGLVHVAVATPDRTAAEKLRLDGSPDDISDGAIRAVLGLAMRLLAGA
jgi:nicotinamide-nucleotide amidase